MWQVHCYRRFCKVRSTANHHTIDAQTPRPSSLMGIRPNRFGFQLSPAERSPIGEPHGALANSHIYLRNIDSSLTSSPTQTKDNATILAALRDSV